MPEVAPAIRQPKEFSLLPLLLLLLPPVLLVILILEEAASLCLNIELSMFCMMSLMVPYDENPMARLGTDTAKETARPR